MISSPHLTVNKTDFVKQDTVSRKISENIVSEPVEKIKITSQNLII